MRRENKYLKSIDKIQNVHYVVEQEYDLSPFEINQLRKNGYEIELVDVPKAQLGAMRYGVDMTMPSSFSNYGIDIPEPKPIETDNINIVQTLKKPLKKRKQQGKIIFPAI